jgi:hypothetical protein
MVHLVHAEDLEVVADGPDVVARNDRGAEKAVDREADVGALDDRPLDAVPVLDQVLLEAPHSPFLPQRDFHVVLTQSPDIFVRNDGDAAQPSIVARVRAGHDAPVLSVPVNDELLAL